MFSAGLPEKAGALVDALAPWSTGGPLPNLETSHDPGRAARVYDDDSRYWLAMLGDRHDPAGVFRCGQVVWFVV